MWLRPWHVMVCVVGLAVGLIAAAYLTDGDRARELLLGLGVNLLSSCVFFVLLELYWRRQERVNGKEVHGFDYAAFARNVGRSRLVRVLGTFIYPLTDHPAHAADRAALLAALGQTVRRPGFVGVQFLFLHPDSPAALARAAERKDDDVLGRMRECLDTLRAFLKGLDADAATRVEVRLFRRPPPFSLFQMDNFASLSFYYRDRPISEVARYEFFLDTPVGGFVEKTFDDLWRDEQTRPLE
ncbi:MAG: hypothetical protein K2X82_05490 [Gemmataceae bacterium]|nr:hypothetical protein [Gemmataceae bacterium]